jgi:hypothetical protein
MGFHHNVSVTGLYSVAAASLSSHRHLFLSAISQAVLAHPGLGLQVRHDDDGTPYFVRLPEIDIGEVVAFEYPHAEDIKDSPSILNFLGQTLSHQNSKGFADRDKALWRILILNLGKSGLVSESQQYGVIFVYHHVIADGKSGLAMHHSILAALNQPSGETGGSQSRYVVRTNSDPLLPDMDELIDYKPTWTSWLLSTFGRFAPCLKKGFRLRKWSGAPYHHDPSAPSRTNIRLLELSADEMKAVQGRCKAQGSSVTSLFQVLVGAVLFEQFKEAQMLRCATAISLRRFFPKSSGVGDSKIGLWIDGFYDIFTRTELLGRGTTRTPCESTWDAARRSRRHIGREIAKGLQDLGFASLQRVADFSSMLLQQLGAQRANSYSIVNLGVLDLYFPSPGRSPDMACTLDRLFLSQSAHFNGSAIQFCLVSTERGGMGISLNWQEGTVPNDDVEAIVENLRRKFAYIGQARD